MYDLENDELPEMIRDEDPEEHAEGYVIDDDLKADWAVRKIKEAKATLDRMTKHYQDQIAKAQADYDNKLHYFNGILRRYLDKLNADGMAKATKTAVKYELPSGTMELKHRDPEFVRDNAKMVAWLESSHRENLVKTEVVKTAQWAEIKKQGITVRPDGSVALVETGEVIDGIQAAPKEDVFTVK